MAESYVWGEGTIYVWTGSATATAVIAYAQNVRATMVRGWENYQTLDGAWHNRHTGQRADVQIGALLTRDNSALNVIADTTAALVHIHLLYNHSAGGSAGRILWSGQFDSFGDNGSEGQSVLSDVSFHCNSWTAYP